MKELTLIEQYILLSILQLEKNAYLVTIREHIKNITGKDMAIATIYVPLERLSRLLPAGRVLVSESGIKTRDDILRLENSPVDAVLVGETLMRSDQPGETLGRLMGRI